MYYIQPSIKNHKTHKRTQIEMKKMAVIRKRLGK